MGMIRIAARTLLVVVVLSSALFASGYENTGVGLKARALGGAFRAIADDWTAACYNPAGYAGLKDNQWGANWAFLNYRDEVNPNFVYGGIDTSTGVFNNRAIYNRYAVISNPSGGIVGRLPLWGETVMGFSIYQPFDQNISWTLYQPLQAYNDSLKVGADQYSSNIDVVAFQLTAARKYGEKLSLGLGLQLLRGDIVYKDITFRSTPMTTDPYTATPYNEIPELTSVNGDGWGFGFKLGAMYKASDKLNIGLTASVPFSITLKGNGELSYIMPKIAALYRYEIQNPNTVAYLFAAGHKVVLNSDFETKLKLPTSFGVGFAYNVNEKWTVSLDGEYTLWSKFKGLEFTYSGFSSTRTAADSASTVMSGDTIEVSSFFRQNYVSDVKWRNTLKAALGSQYEVNNTLTLLCGLSYDQGVNGDKVGVAPQFIDSGDKLGFNGGLMLHFQKWDLGLVGSAITQSKLTSAAKYDAQGDVIGFPGTYKATTFETILSLIHRF